MLKTKILIILFAILARGSSAQAQSEPAVLRLHDLELRFDTSRWRLKQSAPDEVLLTPIGELRDTQDAVRFMKREGNLVETCRAIVRGIWTGELYGAPELTTTDFVGRPAVRLAVHTRCRNATPVGHIVCTENNGSIYSVSSENAISDCRANISILYPEPGPLDELLGKLRFKGR